MVEVPDARAERRLRALKAATIESSGAKPIGATVRNITAGGIKLHLDDLVNAPEDALIVVPMDGLMRPAKRSWQRTWDVGYIFTDGRSVLDDQRDDRRQRMLKAGKVEFGKQGGAVDCIIRDLTGKGARIHLSQAFHVPVEVKLLIVKDGEVRTCRRVWQKGQEVGLAFTGPASQARAPRA